MNDLDYILEGLDSLTDSRVRLLPSDWAEKRRILPDGITPQPGPWRKRVAPYAVEILDQVSGASPIREAAIAKGAQTCLTVSVAENIIGYVIDEDPAAIMYVTADDRQARERMSLMIDPMIDHSGLRSKIIAQATAHKHAKNTGDTQLKKEFPGGFLLAASIGSANRGRTMPIKILLMDEIDAGKESLGKDGDPLKVFKARTSAYEMSKKIFYISTPLEKHTSKIWPLYELGDRRRFFVPCIKCGKMQYLDWGQLRFDTDTDHTLIRDSVHYKCIRCGAAWKNYDKVEFLERGEWRPTATSKRHGLVSYHVSALYSPVGFKSWETIAEEWLEAQDSRKNGDTKPLRVFVNLNLGEPWEDRGETPRVDLVMLRRNEYQGFGCGGVAAVGPLFLTSGTDVHADNIVTEKVAWGQDNRSWSYEYHIIKGDTNEEDTWKEFEQYLSAENYKADAQKIPLVLSMIDSKYRTDKVLEFCSTLTNVVPIIGLGSEQSRAWKLPFKRKFSEIYPKTPKYSLDTVYLKDIVFRNLSRGPNEKGKFPPGFCFFPHDYSEHYFRQLTSEQKTEERTKQGDSKYMYTQIGYRKNHALDCRVYALGALYAYAHWIMTDQQGQESIKWSEFWEIMQKMHNNS